MSEKTEKPTPKKLRDSRKKGQVSQSKDLVSAATLIGVCVVLIAISGYMIETIQELIILPGTLYGEPFLEALKIMLYGSMEASILLILPVCAIAVISAALSNILQTGPLFSAHPIKPELKKISIISGFKKIFCMKNLVEFIKSVIKILFLSVLIYYTVKERISDLMNLPYCGKLCIIPLMGKMLILLLIATAIAFIVIASFDFFFQKAQHIKQLKMSKDEIKREHKDTEGNPEIKGKRKQIHKEIMETDQPEAVKRSSVIVANPTHIAVGLRYIQGETPLPLVTVMGTDHTAQSLKRIAHDLDVPIIVNRPLARALLKKGEVDEYIPSDLIEAVAEVLLLVRRMEKDKKK